VTQAELFKEARVSMKDTQFMPAEEKRIEYGMTYWYTNPDYNDINSEMCRIATNYIPILVEKCQSRQREIDVLRATSLLAKHGLKANIED